MTTLRIVDYTRTPGGRDKTDGDYSGQDYRERYLEPLFQDVNDNSRIRILLDGTYYGFPPSFVDEAFGGLARKYGIERVVNRIEFVSSSDRLLLDEIQDCIYGRKKGGSR